MARIVHRLALGIGALGIALTCSAVARADETVGPPPPSAPQATPPAAAADPPSDRVLSPSTEGVAPLLLQRVAGIDVVAGVRERAVVGTIGSEVDARTLRVGAEGRVRGEVVDGIVASDDIGRPVEVVAGAVAGVAVGRVELVGLGGASWPRGPLPSGPIALGGAAFSF